MVRPSLITPRHGICSIDAPDASQAPPNLNLLSLIATWRDAALDAVLMRVKPIAAPS